MDLWFELDFAAFCDELKKSKTTLSIQEEVDLELYFENEAKKVHELKNEINRIDCCINALVYKYYGLTQEEIQIVENN